MSLDQPQTLVTAQTKNYHVEVFPHYNHGYFEHFRHGDECGGGLWFEGKNLIDYDGTIELPKEVIEALRKLGFFCRQQGVTYADHQSKTDWNPSAPHAQRQAF